MLKLYVALKHGYFENKDGATAIEYGLIAAGISLVIAGVVFTFGSDLQELFTGMSGKLAEANELAQGGE